MFRRTVSVVCRDGLLEHAVPRNVQFSVQLVSKLEFKLLLMMMMMMIRSMSLKPLHLEESHPEIRQNGFYASRIEN